ncbi:MAG: T9SS type A sorting domain-containing protein [Cyclobacteriaceae bacterium]
MKLLQIATFLVIIFLLVIPNLSKAQIPADPTNLFVTEISSTQIDLTWDDNSSNEVDFRIEVADKYDFSGDNQVITIGANGTATASFSHTMLSPETTYFYRVRATNFSGQSGNSNIKMGTTITPPGNALEFDGTDDYIAVSSDNTLQIPTTITISAWVKRTRLDAIDIILEKGGDWTLGQTNYGMALHNNANSNKFYFFFNGGARAAVGVTDLDWHHYAVVAQEGNADPVLYIDGVIVPIFESLGAATISLNESSTLDLHIGAQLGINHFGANIVDEIQIWNIALTTNNIRNNIDSPLSGNEAGLVAYYRFDQDETTDLVLPDRSVNSNDGSWNGNGGGTTTPQWGTSGALVNLYTVTNTNDSGTGSLRWAIDNANSLNDDDILFDIPGVGPWIISPTTNLPAISATYVIDASTQPGWTETNLVIIQQAGTSTIGLNISDDDVEIHGFEITGFDGVNDVAIQVNSADEGQIGGLGKGNVIHGNYYGIQFVGANQMDILGNKIGTDNTGLIASPNEIGIEIDGGADFRIGSSLSGEGNLISGNNGVGISLLAGNDYTIKGNFIGTDITGTVLLGNGGNGIVANISDSQIGGGYPGELNVIAGNADTNISITGGSNVTIEENNIGVDVNGDSFTPSTPYGIEVTGGSDHNIGTSSHGNVIAAHTMSGIFVTGTATGISMQKNLIYCNGDEAITLSSGANNDIQPPTITSVTANSVSGIAGLFDEIHVYRDGSCSGNQGDEFLGTVTADDAGIWSLTGQTIVAGTEWTISATATNATDGTSELTEPEIAVYLGSDNSGTELFNNQVIPVNFGHIPDGTTKELTFTIENSGTKELRITEITPGGDVTSTSPGSATIPVGGSFSMTLALDADPRGIINEVIDIDSRDLDEAEFLFPVTGTRGFLTPKIWWTDDTGGSNDEISRSNLDGDNEDIPYYTGSSVDIRGIAVDTTNNMVFWTTTDAQILCGRIGDSSFEAVGGPIVDESDGSAHDWQAIDVDGTAGKVYWCDVENGQVRRVDFDGSNAEVLVSVSGPRDIALDVAAGKMYYITNNGGARQIWRANLDGTNVENIILGLPFLRGLALDLVNGHIYWTDSDGISRANLDGSGQEEIVDYTSEIEAGAIEIDATSETIYVMDFVNFAPPVANEGDGLLAEPLPDGYFVSKYSYQGDFVGGFQPSQIEDPQFLAIDPRVPHRGGVILKDYDALVTFYNLTGGASWTDNTDWLSGSDVDTWYGITRSDNRVTEVNLETNNLIGTLPSELGDLNALLDLDLADNQLTGTITPQLGSLSNLTDLELSTNQLSGTVPKELEKLTLLTTLDLDHNQLTGAIPSELEALINLMYFEIDDNLLEDLPDLSALVNMAAMEVDDNNFEFDDLEPNAGITGISYSPQADIIGPGDLELSAGGELDVSIPVAGSANQYQWKKDGLDVSGQTSDNLLIPNVKSADAGTYHLEVTSALVAGLTISSESFVVTVSGNQTPDFSFIFYIDENSPEGQQIGAVSASDPEGDALTYTITSGNTNDAFAVGSSTGILTVNSESALDFETNPTFSLMVEANDGNGGVAMVSIAINLNDIVDENPLGVEDLNGQVTVYPNPASETLFVEARGSSINDLDVKMFTISGRQVLTTQNVLARPDGILEIALKDLNSGIYLLKVQGEDEIIVKNILVK